MIDRIKLFLYLFEKEKNVFTIRAGFKNRISKILRKKTIYYINMDQNYINLNQNYRILATKIKNKKDFKVLYGYSECDKMLRGINEKLFYIEKEEK